jgi:hypothetical protein
MTMTRLQACLYLRFLPGIGNILRANCGKPPAVSKPFLKNPNSYFRQKRLSYGPA